MDASALEKSNKRLDLAKELLKRRPLEPHLVESAETEAQKALGLYERNEEAHHVLGHIDLLRSLFKHQLLEMNECLAGVDAEALRSEKDDLLLAADAHFSRAVELSPDFGDAWASRGTVADLLGRYDQAIEYLSKALGFPARLQNIAVVRANLGWAYFHKDDFVTAAKELLQANQFQPGMCLATYRLGRVYFVRKEWEKALQKFRDVTGQNECPIQDAHLYLMKTYVAMGLAEKQPDALPAAEKACVALAPRSCIASQCRALAASSPPPDQP